LGNLVSEDCKSVRPSNLNYSITKQTTYPILSFAGGGCLSLRQQGFAIGIERFDRSVLGHSFAYLPGVANYSESQKKSQVMASRKRAGWGWGLD
jgi:hypothetical protein